MVSSLISVTKMILDGYLPLHEYFRSKPYLNGVPLTMLLIETARTDGFNSFFPLLTGRTTKKLILFEYESQMKWQPVLLMCSAAIVILAAMSMALHSSIFLALAAIVVFVWAGISAFVLKKTQVARSEINSIRIAPFLSIFEHMLGFGSLALTGIAAYGFAADWMRAPAVLITIACTVLAVFPLLNIPMLGLLRKRL